MVTLLTSLVRYDGEHAARTHIAVIEATTRRMVRISSERSVRRTCDTTPGRDESRGGPLSLDSGRCAPDARDDRCCCSAAVALLLVVAGAITASCRRGGSRDR